MVHRDTGANFASVPKVCIFCLKISLFLAQKVMRAIYNG